MKKKILIWGDSPTVPTGFGVVSKNLFKDLHQEYDVEFLGINEFGMNRYDTTKWFIYPVDVTDPLGSKKLVNIVEKNKPDFIILFQDIFNISEVWDNLKEVSEKAKIIIYFPVDGTPFNFNWVKPITQADVVVTYTEFAKKAIQDTIAPLLKDKNIIIHTLDHGIDTNSFFPLSSKEIDKLLIKENLQNRFVILNVNRFQPRKQLALTLRAAALFTHVYKKCKCGNVYHISKDTCDLNGCEGDQVENVFPGHQDVTLILHTSTYEPYAMGPGVSNMLQSQAFNAGYRNKDLDNKALLINGNDVYKNPITEKELNDLYNLASVNISTTVGEGFGFSLAESAATGTVSIAPDNSAIPEVLGVDTPNYLIKNRAHFNMMADCGHMRPIVDIAGILEALEKEYKKWLDNKKAPVKYPELVERVKKKFNWQDKRDFIKKALE